jgi:hypothetical protein
MAEDPEDPAFFMHFIGFKPGRIVPVKRRGFEIAGFWFFRLRNMPAGTSTALPHFILYAVVH